jgi:CarboxypepD_reg-like domain
MFLIPKKQITFFLMLFASFICYSQTKTITGVIKDTLNIPLESANVIAKPLQENAQLKFAIADNKGRYRLELETAVKYEIRVSYIGYLDDVLVLEPKASITQHDFILKNTGQQLKEVIIKHDYKPIIIKKDTMTFNVKSFANGNERKMKELLEKLPGVEVDKKGNVTVQGKKVTQMLVEGKPFFGGGSKLAVENIPADALDQIEVIDHFNQVGFMKQVSDSEDLAMNVKLKADKKQFVFGDIESGIGNKPYYLGHAALFYYAPKTNVSFIGDANNIGKSTFTFDDLLRFDGGISSFLSGRKSFTNLYAFANDNTDVIENKSQFGAANFSFDISPKFAISGYTILSKLFTAQRFENQNTYLQNNAIAFENRLQNTNRRSALGIGNIKLDYSASTNEKLYYNMQFQLSNNNDLTDINSTTNINNTLFENSNKADNISVKQYIEWHKKINDNHTTTFVINQAYDDNRPQNTWLTNESFLSGLIPLVTDANYNISQIKKVNNNNIDALFKHYWVLDNFNHIYTNIGNNYSVTKIETFEKQLLTNGTINDFSTNGFGNNINYKLNDAYLGFEYKFKIGNWTNKPGLYFHLYNLNTNQVSGNYSLSRTFLQPQFNSEYEFNKSESLKFAYKLVNTYADANQYANLFTLQNYNSVFRGNALLENERFHNASLSYNKMNMYRGITINANISYNKKLQTLRNQIELLGINQFNTAVITDNPETTYRFSGSITKKIYKFNLKLNTNLNWFNYIQTLNNITTTNDRNSQLTGISLRTANKKWPDFSIGYTKGFNQIKGISDTEFKNDAFNTAFEATVLKSWIFKIEYDNLKNTNNNNQSNYYDIANSSLRYQKKNSPFGFEFTANNFLDNKVKNNYSFSDYLISEQSTYVLPRVFMFSVSYKL